MMLRAHNMNEAKEKVLDVVMKSSIWNYKKNEFYLCWLCIFRSLHKYSGDIPR